MRKLALSPKKIVSLVGEVNAQTDRWTRLVVAGTSAEAVAEVCRTLSQGGDPFEAERLVESLELDALGSLPVAALEDATVLVLVASLAEFSQEDLKSSLAQLEQAETPVVLVLTEAPGFQLSFASVGVGPKRIVGLAPDGKPAAELLTEAVIDAAGDGLVALAAQLPVLREAACAQIVRRTAKQNGVIGVLFVLPGADMPVMTLNEARMILKIAAVHGETVGVDRAFELLGVVGSGYGLRAVARQALDFLPGPGWIVKGSIAYSGTLALGRAAQAYFDSPARLTPNLLTPLVEKLRQLRR